MLGGSGAVLGMARRWLEEDFLALAQRLRARRDERPLRVPSVAVPVLTRMGLIAHPAGAECARDLLRRAQVAQKMAKSYGGNQVCVYVGPVGGRVPGSWGPAGRRLGSGAGARPEAAG